MNFNQSTRDMIGNMALGMRVDRATATLPQSTAGALFTVTGKCAILGIIGEVTTIIETQANNTKLVANPTVGTSADLCTVLDISADEVGALYGLAAVGSALAGGTAGYAPMCTVPCVVNTGTIDLNCAASNTGSVAWSLWYVPLEAGASIVAA
jgi:hypothetical protein